MPSLDEYLGFWNASRRGVGMIKFYGLWLGGLAAIAFVLSRVGFVENFPLLSIIGAFSYAKTRINKDVYAGFVFRPAKKPNFSSGNHLASEGEFRQVAARSPRSGELAFAAI